MFFSRRTTSALLLTILLLGAATAFAQNRATGSIKGKVRLENGGAAAGVAVIATQGEREIARVTTDRSGEFTLANLQPGLYTLTFRRPGLRVGTLPNIPVEAGRTRNLRDRLYLPADEGSLAFINGSVFTEEGRSIPGARIELHRINADGTTRRVEEQYTNDMGAFAFRLAPDAAKYRITARREGMETSTRDIDVDGAAVYRVALTLRASGR